MTKLSVNLNKVALIRNTRPLDIPDVLEAARVVINAGAHGVTVHPRPDERHIRYSDAYDLAQMLTVEFNIEGNPFTGRYMDIVADIKPAQATLVPDNPSQSTSDHGWNLKENIHRLTPIIKKLKDCGIRVSFFMDPDPEGIELARKLGADRIELYTEPYAKAFSSTCLLDETLKEYADAAKAAAALGLGVNAGHDLNLHNLRKFLDNVPNVLEVSIGHALIADAIFMGLEKTVKKYLKILSKT